LAHQRVGQALAGTDRHTRDVVDGLVGVQQGRLAADVRQSVDDVGTDVQQTQLEHLEQAHRTGANDHGIGCDRIAGGRGAASCDALPWFHVQRISSDSLPVRSFHCS
jgi:hypothetical protein